MNGSVTTSKPPPYSPTMYRPLAQATALTPGLRFAVRTRGPSGALLAAVRSAIREFRPDVPIIGLTTIEAFRETQLAPLRINAVVLGAFAVLATFVAVVGVYGTIAYLVHQGSTEISIRMALGAQPVDVLALNVRLAFSMTLRGIVVGIVGSFALTRILRAVLYDTSPTDPQVFAGAATVLAAAALAGGYFPARRATRIDPARALQSL